MDLYTAIRSGHGDKVHLLLDLGADVNIQEGENETALYTAASEGDIGIVQLLLEKGADVNIRNIQEGHNGTALYAAASRGYIEIVRLLLEKGADVNIRNIQEGQNGTALYAAASRGYTGIVRLLLERGADVNIHKIQEGQNESALYTAASRGYIEIVRMLLQKGAGINSQGGEYGTALQAAIVKGNKETTQWLIEKGVDINVQGGKYGTALQTAVFRGDIVLIQLLLKTGANVNAKSGEYGTALQAAALGRPTAIIRLLLDQGADINAQGGEYGTALQAAAFRAHLEIVQILIDQGADVNIQGGKFGTTLQAAASEGNIEIVRLLLEQGADVNTQGGEHGTALQAAISRGHPGIARLLLENGADVNAEGGKFGSALLAAIMDGNVPITTLLLDEYGDKIPITEKILGKAVKLSKNVIQLLDLILQKGQGKFTITKETFMSATDNEKGGEILALLLESSVQMSEDIIWVRELGKVGYSTKEIVELFLEHKNDSPWIFFEPTGIPCLDIQTDRHIPGCCHAVSPSEERQKQLSNTLVESRQTNLDHQEIIFQIQELCGLAGVKPTTRKLTDWIGHIELSDSDRSLSVSYALPTDKGKPRDFQIIWSRIARALEGFYQAAALMQANDLCCDSFTILKSGSLGHDPSSSPLGEIVSVPLKPVLDLIEELQSFMNRDSELSDPARLLSLSTAILELIWPDIPKVPDRSRFGWCLHLCALAAQFLCLGLLSYSQAHIGPLQPFFLDSFSRRINMMGLDKRHIYPYLIVELVSLTCLGNMTRGQVLLFYNSQNSPQKRSPETQIQRLMQSHDILGHAEDILDTWGPGNLILRGDGSSTPVAIKVGDGFIFDSGKGKNHWSQQIPDIDELSSIDITQPLLIGSLVAVNAACRSIEATSRIISANVLEELGTSRSSWKKSQRQLAIQGGQYVVCQASETWNKQTGVTIKSQVLTYSHQRLIYHLDSYWGVQVSYCTGVARRVRLRKLVADLIPHFCVRSNFDSEILRVRMNDEMLRPKDLEIWLSSLSPDIRAEILDVIHDILNTLRHTGIDSTETSFCIAWPFEGNITQCFKIPLEQDSSWAIFLADSHDCATFAYITMECLEANRFKCSNIPEPSLSICLLETAVLRSGKENLLREPSLQHQEICFFSKQDNLLWIKVLKKHADQPASLVHLMHIQSISYSIRQRLNFRERKKKRARLQECGIMGTRGEAVSVFSA